MSPRESIATWTRSPRSNQADEEAPAVSGEALACQSTAAGRGRGRAERSASGRPRSPIRDVPQHERGDRPQAPAGARNRSSASSRSRMGVVPAEQQRDDHAEPRPWRRCSTRRRDLSTESENPPDPHSPPPDPTTVAAGQRSTTNGVSIRPRLPSQAGTDPGRYRHPPPAAPRRPPPNAQNSSRGVATTATVHRPRRPTNSFTLRRQPVHRTSPSEGADGRGRLPRQLPAPGGRVGLRLRRASPGRRTSRERAPPPIAEHDQRRRSRRRAQLLCEFFLTA